MRLLSDFRRCVILIYDMNYNINNMLDKEYLKNLLIAPSPSGNEILGTEVFKSFCESFGTYDRQDKIGNCYYRLGHGPLEIMLSAHIDEIAARVQYISDDGMISFVRAGGIDKKVLPGSCVLVISESGKLISGVIGKKPIHLEESEERNEVSSLESLKVDVGCSSKKEVIDLGVNIGSWIIQSRESINLEFGEHRLCGPGLDDKIGVFIVSEILKHLSTSDDKSWEDKYTIYFVSTVQEEVGLRGATIATQLIKPDISIDFDVTFSTDGGIDVKKEELGDIVLGNGCVIEYGPDKSNRLASIFKSIAEDLDQPVQYSVAGSGGTNTDAIQLYGGDCETMLISIPNRNMHTPVEVCDYRDVTSAIKVVSKAIQDRCI